MYAPCRIVKSGYTGRVFFPTTPPGDGPGIWQARSMGTVCLAEGKAMSSIELPIRPPQESKVLVVDDDERIVEVFSAILSRDGYQILSAADGPRALDLVANEHPDVVVLDVMLPGLDGVEVCRRIKMAKETHFVPVILVTGLSARGRRLDGLNAGADDFLDKPVDPLELTARVRSLLRTKQLHDEVEMHRRELERRVEERTLELRKANERLEELSRVKGRVLTIVSHELRTPLHQAKLALGLARQDEIPPAQREEMHQKLDESFDLLMYRLDDIDAFSDPTDLKLVPVSVHSLLAAAVEQARRLSRKNSGQFDLDIPRKLPPVVVDATLMTRAIAHLIHNAVKFGEGKPVHVRAAEVEGGVRVEVRDEGIGISEALKPKLFVPLEQGDDSSTRRYGGMGIGLALVKMVMDAHHITIEFESVVGKGTTFYFVLPIAGVLSS